jgi:hypothetical protein
MNARVFLVPVLLLAAAGQAFADETAGSWRIVHAGQLFDRPGVAAPRGASTIVLQGERVYEPRYPRARPTWPTRRQ